MSKLGSLIDEFNQHNIKLVSLIEILERPEYLGHTVNFKYYRKSYRDKRDIKNDPKDWAVFKNTHEPIINQATFDLVQKMRQKRRRNTKAKRAKTDQQKELRKAEKPVIEAKKRVSELDNIINRLYEDNILGKLSDERFNILSKDYEFEQSELKQEIDNLETRLSKQKEDVKNVQKFLEIVQRYTTFESLIPSIVNELIDRIEIHKPDKSTGKLIQQIDIY